MRFAFAFLSVFCASVALAGDAAPAPTLAAPAATESVLVTSAPATVTVVEAAPVCVDGTCALAGHSHRKTFVRGRLFGGCVVRSHERTVLRPAARCSSGRCCN